MHFSFSALACLLPLISFVKTQDTSLDTVVAAFEAANIPEDIQITFDPTVLFEVTFPETTGPDITLNAGVTVPRDDTVGPPTFAISSTAGSTGPFVVSAVDPDAPTPQDPTEAQIRHFLGSNFFISSSSSNTNSGPALLTNTTPALSDFLQPSPPAGSPAHRYIFLLFNQPEGFNEQTLVNASTSIANFNISAFALATGLGNPIAGTFMMVAPDSTTA